MRASLPPWIKKPSEKHLWVPAGIAAREWFKKSREHVVRQCKAKYYAGIYDTFFDGDRWFIKLPEPLPRSAFKKSEKAVMNMTAP